MAIIFFRSDHYFYYAFYAQTSKTMLTITASLVKVSPRSSFSLSILSSLLLLDPRYIFCSLTCSSELENRAVNNPLQNGKMERESFPSLSLSLARESLNTKKERIASILF